MRCCKYSVDIWRECTYSRELCLLALSWRVGAFTGHELYICDSAISSKAEGACLLIGCFFSLRVLAVCRASEFSGLCYLLLFSPLPWLFLPFSTPRCLVGPRPYTR